MWANVVVVKAKFLHRLLQRGCCVDLNVANAGFKRPKKALNPAVLPRRMWIASLMANAQLLHSRFKFVRHKCAIVVGANGFGFAKGDSQVVNQGQNRVAFPL